MLINVNNKWVQIHAQNDCYKSGRRWVSCFDVCVSSTELGEGSGKDMCSRGVRGVTLCEAVRVCW